MPTMRFDDYHRTVIGYHGTKLSVARKIVNRERGFQKSENRDDWLGHGVYFWEYAPQQALWWAERRKKRHQWKEPIAILASMIRLGFCFDLLDPRNIEYLVTVHKAYTATCQASDKDIPENFNNRKYLDCEVFQYAYAAIESDPESEITRIDSARAVYVPSGNGKRIWKRSWITIDSHIQICVRNPACILGTWLHYPQNLEVGNETEDSKTPPINIEPKNQTGGGESEENAS